MEHAPIRKPLNRYGVDQIKYSKPIYFTDESFGTILIAKKTHSLIRYLSIA